MGSEERANEVDKEECRDCLLGKSRQQCENERELYGIVPVCEVTVKIETYDPKKHGKLNFVIEE